MTPVFSTPVQYISSVTTETVYVLVYWFELHPYIYDQEIFLCPLSRSYKVWVDRSHHFGINVLKSLCVTLMNVTTEHLFSITSLLLNIIMFLCVPLVWLASLS